MIRLPDPFKFQPSGNGLIDRIQNGVRALDAYIRLLAGALPIAIGLQGDFTTQSALLQRTPLRFPVKAGELWAFEMQAFAGVTGDTLGMSWAISAPKGSELDAILSSSLTGMTDISFVQITAPDTPTSAVHTVNGGERPDWIHGRVRAAGDGEICIMCACTTAGRTLRVRSKALLRAMRYEEVAA